MSLCFVLSRFVKNIPGFKIDDDQVGKAVNISMEFPENIVILQRFVIITFIV